jgi:hypothetical protein
MLWNHEVAGMQLAKKDIQLPSCRLRSTPESVRKRRGPRPSAKTAECIASVDLIIFNYVTINKQLSNIINITTLLNIFNF